MYSSAHATTVVKTTLALIVAVILLGCMVALPTPCAQAFAASGNSAAKELKAAQVSPNALTPNSAKVATTASAKTVWFPKAKIKKARYLRFNGSPSSTGFSDGRYKSYKFSNYQNFSYTPDGKYIFGIDVAKKGITRSTGLVCFTLSKSGKLGTFKDGTVLPYYGHSESIAITQPDLSEEVYHVWVAKCKNKYPKNKAASYGTIIERLTFSFTGKNGKAKVSDKIDISNFNEAGVVLNNGKRMSTKLGYSNPERVAAAASEIDNRVAFRATFTGNGINYLIYDLKKLSADMDKVVASGKHTYDLKRAKNFLVSNTKYSDVPLTGFQSFDVDAKHLYVAGHTLQSAKYKAGVYRVDYKNSISETSGSVSKKVWLQVSQEFEGIKVKQLANGKSAYYFSTLMEEGKRLRYDQYVSRVIV